MNFIAQESWLNLPIGTKISFRQLNKTPLFGCNYPNNYQNQSSTKQVKLINGCVTQTFYAIFGENDVDFEICCDNQLCPRGIRLTLVINETRYPYYIPPAKLSTFQALETNGRKLHFLSQNTKDGERMVAATAEKHGTSYATASMNCSKIIFFIEVEHCLNQQTFSDPFGVELIGDKICVHIQSLSGKTTDVVVGTNNTILDLKKLLAKQEVTTCNHTLIYNSVSLNDDRKLVDYGLCSDSMIYVIYYPGTAPSLFASPTASNSTNALFGSTTAAPMNSNPQNTPSFGFNPQNSSLSPTFGFTPPNNTSTPTFGFGSTQSINSLSTHPTILKQNNTSNGKLFSGERGVICYGEQSNQKFKNYDNFKTDYNLIVNSFVIEMRLQSKYAPI